VDSGKLCLLKFYSSNLAMAPDRNTIFFSLNGAHFDMGNGACIVRKDRAQPASPNRG
jgi:hypothetical protein